MSESIRSFIAFDIESPQILERITYMQRLLVGTGADIKLVEPENIHITLRFLGNISHSMVERIYEGMRQVVFTPFEVKIQGLGAFPNTRHPRVLWAGITEGSVQLRSIFTQLEPYLRSLGFPPDQKGFSPHLTIARVRSGRNKAQLTRCLEENRAYDFGVVRANCLRLKRSDLTPRGPIYSTLKEYCPQA
ncbi:MAG: RNA 2',3'-cyclic phosphodiesterase [Candidatus Bathyarchaeia archaeon]